MDVTKEELKFDDEGNAVYTMQIKDFYDKMKSWETGKGIDSKHFKFQDVELYLRVFPNGEEATAKGYVSVYLWNATKKQVFTSFKVRIGQKELSSIATVPPERGFGWGNFLPHSSLVNQKGDEQLKVICTIMKLKYLDTEGNFDTMESINEEKKRLNDVVIALNKSTASQKETERKIKEATASQTETKRKLNETNVKLAELEAKSTASKKETERMLNEATASQKETERKLDETNLKLARLEAKIDDLDKGRKEKKPSCPICYEEMLPNTRIAQCISGHLICWSCKDKMVKIDCPSCGRPVNGRAFGMESYLKYLYQE